MEIHNTMEELVIDEVNAICDSLEAKKNEGICTCSQCRQDAVCYVLNRTDPHYVVSHRGAARVNQAAGQQSRADLTSLVYDGIKHVSHNQRPYFTHNRDSPAEKPSIDTPVFNIPTIIGRVFNGLNFSPITGITVELLQNGVLALMKDNNWQNPYVLIPNTGGTFTFWPRPVPAEKPEIRGSFEFTVKITTEDFAELSHIFTIPVISEQVGTNFSLSRTFKLPDLYLFPPGEEKDQLVINV